MSSTKRNYKIIYSKNELNDCITSIPSDSNNVMFHNVLSKMKVGNREMGTHFNTVFMNEDTTLLLPADGSVTEEEFRKELLQEIPFHEVSFLRINDEESDREKKIRCVHSIDELSELLWIQSDSGDDVCTYYPKMRGILDLYYVLDDDSKELLERTRFNGVIDFENQVLLLPKEMPYDSVIDSLWYGNISTCIDWSLEYPYCEKKRKNQK